MSKSDTETCWPYLLINEDGRTVARSMREWLTREGSSATTVTLATCYISIRGLLQVCDVLTDLVLRRDVQVRLLLGVAPDESVEVLRDGEPVTPGTADINRLLERGEVVLRVSVNGHTASKAHSMRLYDLLRLLHDPRVQCRRETVDYLHAKGYTARGAQHVSAVIGSSNLTLGGLMRNKEANAVLDAEGSLELDEYLSLRWGTAKPYDLAGVVAEAFANHPAELVFLRMLWEQFGGQVNAPASRLELLPFQRDAVAQALDICRRHGGALLADAVGLGKTFVAGEIARLAIEGAPDLPEHVRGPVLIIAPATVKETWDSHLAGWGLHIQVLSYDTLTNTFKKIGRGGQTWARYGLVICDEAHTLRDPHTQRMAAVRNLLADHNHRPWLLLATATPVNNSAGDLFELLCLLDPALEPDWVALSTFAKARASNRPPIGSRMADIYANPIHAPKADEDWMHAQQDQRMVRRDWQFIKRAYPDAASGINRPELRSLEVHYHLTPRLQRLLLDVIDAVGEGHHLPPSASRQLRDLRAARHRTAHPDNKRRLTLAAYNLERYLPQLDGPAAAEPPLFGLLRAMLLKRLESSCAALASTAQVMCERCENVMAELRLGIVRVPISYATRALQHHLLDENPDDDPHFTDDVEDALRRYGDPSGQFLEFPATDADAALRLDLTHDIAILRRLAQRAADAVPDDPKPKALEPLLRQAATHPAGPKLVIFSSARTTIRDLADRINDWVEHDPALAAYRGRTAVLGANHHPSHNEVMDVLSRFSPHTASRAPSNAARMTPSDDYDLLLCTDLLSEGINIQDSALVIHYDLTWNPQRMGQRTGRLQRLRSRHHEVTSWTVLPDQSLDLVLHILDLLMHKSRLASATVGVPDRILPHFPQQPRSYTELLKLMRHPRTPFRPIFADQARAWLGEAMRKTSIAQAIHDLPRGAGASFRASAATSILLYCFTVTHGPDAPPTIAFVRVTVQPPNQAPNTNAMKCLEEIGVEPQKWAESVYGLHQAGTTISQLSRHSLREFWRHLDYARAEAADLTGCPRALADERVKLVCWIHRIAT